MKKEKPATRVVLDPPSDPVVGPILESRQLRVMPSKPGGTSRGKSLSFRVILPRPWLAAMGVDQDARDVVVSFDGTRIFIEAAAPPEAPAAPAADAPADPPKTRGRDIPE